MGTPSDQFLHLLWRPPYVFFFHSPWDHFFAYYIGAPRSLSSLTIWGPSDLFLLIQYGGPSQISFIVYYMGPPPPPTPQISFFACYMGSPQISFCAYFLGAPLRSIFSLAIWGPSDQFLRILPITKNTTAVFVVYILQIHLPRWFSPTKKTILLRLLLPFP